MEGGRGAYCVCEVGLVIGVQDQEMASPLLCPKEESKKFKMICKLNFPSGGNIYRFTLWCVMVRP